MSEGTVVLQPGDGRVLRAFGVAMNIKIGPEQTGGTFSLGVNTTPPGGGPPPHKHQAEDELLLVTEGRFRFLTNGDWIEGGPGTAVYFPKGVVHTFQNIGETPASAWVIATPSGFEHFFEQCAEVFTAAGPSARPDMAKIMAISTEHGIEYVPPLGGPPPGR